MICRSQHVHILISVKYYIPDLDQQEVEVLCRRYPTLSSLISNFVPMSGSYESML